MSRTATRGRCLLLAVWLLLGLTACRPAGAADVNRLILPLAHHRGEVPRPAEVWRWHNPLPSGNSIRSIQLVDPSVGWAVGDSGTIRKSNDGGVTWVSQSSGTTNKLNKVRALSTSTAWVSGANGTILRTDDGGTTWRRQASGTTADLTGLSAVSSTVAWAAGGDAVFGTADGGATWDQRGTATATLHGVAARSARLAWASGNNGLVMRTTDGGATWEIQHQNSPDGGLNNHWLFTIAAISDTQVTAAGYYGTPGPYGDWVLSSTDGGATWTDTFLTSGGSGVADLAVVSPLVTWAASRDGSLRWTVNGGATWRPALNTSASGQSVAALSDRQAWLGGSGGAVWQTQDGGSSWTQRSPSSSLTAARLTSLSAAGGTLWAAGLAPQSALVKSTDEGRTWASVATRLRPWAVAALSPSIVWLAGEYGEVARSVDGGATWSSAQPDPEALRTVAVAPVSELVAWMATGPTEDTLIPGRIFKTVDGGATWIDQDAPAAFVTRLVAVSPQIVWALDPYQRRVLRTADGGATWTSQSTPGGIGLYNGLTAVSATTAWVTGRTGQRLAALYRTDDGGANWTALDPRLAAGVSLYDVTAQSAQVLWTVGSGGTILYSSNGGDDWTRQSSGTGNDLYAVVAPTRWLAAATGDAGTILRATTE